MANGQSDHRGSDIRLVPGLLYDPSAWPRLSFATADWDWRDVQSYAFKGGEHINILEARAYLNYLRRRNKRPDRHRKRFLHVLDSQVVTAVVVKGRSSAQKLNNVLRRIAGQVLASRSVPFYAWVRSEDNPADAPSRKRVRLR